MHTDEKYLCNHTKGRDVDIAHPKKLKNRYEKKERGNILLYALHVINIFR